MRYSYLLWITFTVAFASCRPTKVLQESQTKYYTGKKLQKIAVMALPGELLDVMVFEDKVVASMKTSGAEVMPVYKIFPVDSIPSDGPSIWQALKKKGFDGMVEVKFVSIRVEETNTENDQLTNREYRIMDVSNYGKLVQEYGKREDKGAVFKDVKVKMDVRLYDYTSHEAQIIWSARVETSNPRNARHVASGLSKKVGSKLRKHAFPD